MDATRGFEPPNRGFADFFTGRRTCAFDHDGCLADVGYTDGYKSSRWTTFSTPAAQFKSLLERETGIEPATLCLGIKSTLPQTVPDAPFAQFDLYSKPLGTAPHCLRLFQSVRYNKQAQSLDRSLIGLPNMSWSLIVMVKSPKPGACAAAFTVGLPKPRPASHVAASMRSLVLAPFSRRNTLRTKSVSSLPSTVRSWM